jgi:hypothetical protein
MLINSILYFLVVIKQCGEIVCTGNYFTYNVYLLPHMGLS